MSVDVLKMAKDALQWASKTTYSDMLQVKFDAAIAALTSAISEAESVGESGGMKPNQMEEQMEASKQFITVILPKEPTEEMLEAGRLAGDFHIMHYEGDDKPVTPRYSLIQAWKAMLEVAQRRGPDTPSNDNQEDGLAS